MVMQPMYGNGVIESPTIEISQEGLRSILNQIESELLDSEVYRRTMAGLQTMLGEASNTAQILVKAVGREAVRLTFQQVVRQYKVIPVTAEETHKARREELDSPQTAENNSAQIESHSNALAVEEISKLADTTIPSPSVTKAIGDTKPTKKLTKAQLAAQKAVQEREELLRQVGRELRQARLNRSLSVRQLHTQTLVPQHHIEALEAGRLEQLPEDIYVRGFICRIAHSLGLNGATMTASLPEPDSAKSVIPSWYRSTATSVVGLQLSSVHLYLGYTALIAGAVGGLSWMSNKPLQEISTPPEPSGSSQASISPKAERAASTTKPGLKKSTKIGVKAGADIAPPEALPF